MCSSCTGIATAWPGGAAVAASIVVRRLLACPGLSVTEIPL
ncbi:hypothetical protein OG592_36570 [Streptomyces avidinii]|nr:hypothetical protein OG592_36570 [Streptomyces avidinii]